MLFYERKSFKNIPGVNSLYIQGSNANENQIQAEYDDPEYSEIPVYLQVRDCLFFRCFCNQFYKYIYYYMITYAVYILHMEH